MNTFTKTENNPDLSQINQVLEEAKQEMQAVLENNREKMREVSEQQKLQEQEYNRLKAEHDSYEKRIEEATLKQERDEANTLIQERKILTPALVEQAKALVLANEALNSVTSLVNQQQEQIRLATVEAIRLTFQVQATDIQNRILDVMQSLNFGTEFESFNKGRSIVQDLECENAARLTVHNERLDVEIARLIQSMEDAQDDAALEALQRKIDAGEIPVDPEVTISSPPTALDDLGLGELDLELEPVAMPDAEGSLLTEADRAFLDGISQTIEGLNTTEE